MGRRLSTLSYPEPGLPAQRRGSGAPPELPAPAVMTTLAGLYPDHPMDGNMGSGRKGLAYYLEAALPMTGAGGGELWDRLRLLAAYGRSSEIQGQSP